MYTLQIWLYPPLLNKSFFKYELCCLQQFSASRHHPLSGYTASVHLTVPTLLSALRTHDGMHHPPTSYSWVENACCRMLNAQAYTCVYNWEHGKKTVCVFSRESVGIGVIFCCCQLARGLQINVCVCVHMHMCLVQTKAPSQTPLNRLARLLRNKGLRENADFTGKRREPCACVCVRGERA